MAVQTKVVRFFMAGAVAIALSGCVTVPDAIKGTSPTPQQDLVRVMNAPELYVGQEARFGGKVVEVINQQGKTRLEIATVPLDDGARPVLGEASRGRIYADVSGFLDPVDFRGQLVTRRRADYRFGGGENRQYAIQIYDHAGERLQTLAYRPAGGDAATANRSVDVGSASVSLRLRWLGLVQSRSCTGSNNRN